MGQITLICTVHNENGRCNERELAKILKFISPDVIFEEIRPSDFTQRYGDMSLYSMEMRAISAYLREKSARQVPVDQYEIPESFRNDQRRLDDHIETHADEYWSQWDDIGQAAAEFGFRYLNSPDFIAQFRRAETLFEEAISKYGNNDLMELLSTWNAQLRRRENSMLDNIYEFCRGSSFTEGVFLVGAGHMAHIVEGIGKRVTQEADTVHWKIWNGL